MSLWSILHFPFYISSFPVKDWIQHCKSLPVYREGFPDASLVFVWLVTLQRDLAERGECWMKHFNANDLFGTWRNIRNRGRRGFEGYNCANYIWGRRKEVLRNKWNLIEARKNAKIEDYERVVAVVGSVTLPSKEIKQRERSCRPPLRLGRQPDQPRP